MRWVRTMNLDETIGYVCCDGFCEDTLQDEMMGLVRAGMALQVARSGRKRFTLSHFELSTFVDTTEPMCIVSGGVESLLALLVAPWRFGGRFWSMLGQAIRGGPREGAGRLALIKGVPPAALLALRWRGHGVRHIHAHGASGAATLAMHAAHLLGTGFSFTGQSRDLFVDRAGLGTKLRRARFVICISRFHRRFYIALGADPSRLALVHAGIDPDRLAPLARPRRRGEAGPARVLAVGPLEARSGLAHLIEACALLRDRGVAAECLIVGDGPEREALIERIRLRQLGSMVRVRAAASGDAELAGLLASARVFALPCVRARDGDMEGLPRILIEAMALGLPVVSTRIAGITDLIVDRRTGLLVQPGDEPGLATAIERLLGDEAAARRIGHQGRSWVRDHFNRKHTGAMLAGLIRTAVVRPGGDRAVPPPSAVPWTRHAEADPAPTRPSSQRGQAVRTS